ncbi:CdaR family transcriptional regulator [Conexibacter sp. SYSU D00693]|uniref:PucR family transcriptional regulator n=1 Tax=Conexibacter sp. SYSU D00693 TaxID=2812560 RepID=UPI00196B5799|nr:helix-turn-helix domain-containing protein [Conexibacter sp. SYSU D00693]
MEAAHVQLESFPQRHEPLAPDTAARLRGLAAAFLEQCREGDLGGVMSNHLLEQQPELRLREDDTLYAETRASCQQNIEEILSRLHEGMPGWGADPPPMAAAWARSMVRRGVELQAVLRAYRLGHGLLWHEWSAWVHDQCEDTPQRAELLHASSAHMFAYIDAVCARLVEFYDQERQRWARSASAVRAEVVRQLLAHEPVNVEAASSALGYELRRRHVALIVWDDREVAESDDVVEAAQAFCAAAGHPDALVVPAGLRVVWAWCGGAEVEAEDFDLRDVARKRGLRVATGEVWEGAEGFARSHEDASHAFRVAQVLRRRPGSVTRFRSVALSALLSADPALARRFADAELTVLRGEDDATRRIRATLQVFLEEGGSYVRAARRLGVHENTVAYRVHRAEDLLGHPVAERRLELEAALLVHRTLETEA